MRRMRERESAHENGGQLDAIKAVKKDFSSEPGWEVLRVS